MRKGGGKRKGKEEEREAGGDKRCTPELSYLQQSHPSFSRDAPLLIEKTIKY